MTDGVQAFLWMVVLGTGVAGCVLLHKLGVPATYVRDVLHIGAGVWVLGWPAWNGWVAPTGLAAVAAALTGAVLPLARRSSSAAAFRDSVSGGDERWSGLMLYTLAFAVLTPIGLRSQPFAAGAALWALCLGDGIGGAVGRRFGKRSFAIPGGKRKSIEGTLAVAVAAGLGVAGAGRWLGQSVGFGTAALLGGIAAVVEAVSPRSSDNALVPASVFVASLVLT